MACLDPATGRLVARILFDGPPRSGKTTTVRAVASHLGRPVEDAGEEDGRTLFFDRFEYTGGSFRGQPIECEVISIPGQLTYLTRRIQLLMLADVVVYILDSARHRLRENLEGLVALEQVIEHLGEPRLPLIVQANKRDLSGAVPLEALTEWFGHMPARHWRETVASAGEGVRETFVMAAGAAAERARRLEALGRLETCHGTRSAPDLLGLLEATESENHGPGRKT